MRGVRLDGAFRVDCAVRMVKRVAIVVHRWLGVALCLFFLLWFPSGDRHDVLGFPGGHRRRSAGALAGARSVGDPAVAGSKPSRERGSRRPPTQVAAEHVRRPAGVSLPRRRRRMRSSTPIPATRQTGGIGRSRCAASRRRGRSQPASAATVATLDEADQWTVQGSFRACGRCGNISWPNGEQVYVSAGDRRGRAVHDHGVAAGRVSRRRSRTGSISRRCGRTGRSGAGSSSGRPASAPSRRSSASSSACGCIRRRSATASPARRQRFRIADRNAGTRSSA